jgi:eukaryotic-like serine/threonine-protein kinase
MNAKRNDASAEVDATQVLDRSEDSSPTPGKRPSSANLVKGFWLRRRNGSSAGGGASSAEEFLKSRLELYGFVGASFVFARVTFECLSALGAGMGFDELLMSPSGRWYSFVVFAGFLMIGVSARWGPRSMVALRALDATALIVACAIPPWLGIWTTLPDAGGLLMLLGSILIVMWRSATVPSHPLFTFPIVALALFANQSAAIFGCGEVSLELLSAPERISWVVVSALIAASASQIIFGLQRRASRAERMGQYQIEGKLGSGGMGEVYSARHALMCRPVAIKLLRRDERDPKSLDRFEREVRLTSHLEHPNTIRIYDFGQTHEGRFFYVMERLRGLDLQKLTSEIGALPPGRVVNILRQVCGSLSEAHNRGLVHRDIKPANIILCVSGGIFDFVKVVDFGLVKDVGKRGSIDLTEEGGLMGTPLYLAPELIRDPNSATARSDLYALGCVAWTLLTGHRLFEAETMVEVLNAHLNTPPPRPSEVSDREIPPGLESIVMRLLSKEPADRIATAAELDAMLMQLRDVPEWTQYESAAWWRHREETDPDHEVSVQASDLSFYASLGGDSESDAKAAQARAAFLTR